MGLTGIFPVLPAHVRCFVSKYFGKFTYIILGLLFVSLDVGSFLFFIVRGYVDIPGIVFSFWYLSGLLSYSPSSSSRIFRIRRTVYPAITRIRMTGYQWNPQSAKLMCPSASLLSAGMLSPVFPLPSASAPVSVLSATSVVSSEPVSASVSVPSVTSSPSVRSDSLLFLLFLLCLLFCFRRTHCFHPLRRYLWYWSCHL